MELNEKVKELARKIDDQKKHVQTEQAAKMSFVVPFLQMLGYDVFNATEVIPEYTADWGIKKGEKVDYAIKINGKFVMLIECKPIDDKLDAAKEDQLARYFANLLEAKIGVLTNGIIYKFYTDLNEHNIMDRVPFFVFDFSNPKEKLIQRLEMFTKTKIIQTDTVNSDIVKLRNYSATVDIINKDFQSPSEEWVRYIIKQLPFKKSATDAILEEFKTHTKKAIEQYEQNYFDEQLRKLRDSAKAAEEVTQKAEQIETPKTNIFTTVHELQALSIVRAILHNKNVSTDKVALKDYENYCNIEFKSQGRPCIVRLHFNEAEQGKYFISFPGNPDLDPLGKIMILDVDAINEHSDKIIATVKRFLEMKEKLSSDVKVEPNQ